MQVTSLEVSVAGSLQRAGRSSNWATQMSEQPL